MKRFWSAALAALLVLFIPITALANSAEPPSLTILVRGGPEDLDVSIQLTDAQSKQVSDIQLELKKRPFTRYYQWYGDLSPWMLEFRYDMPPDAQVEAALVARGQGVHLVLPLDGLPTWYTGYSRLLTLDIPNGRLLEGEHPLWWVALKFLLRLGSTLLIEGAVFWRFGYRQKESWFDFLVTNLITQAGLNLFLFGQQLETHSIFVMVLLFAEPVIFLLELLLLCTFVKEKKKLVTAAFTFAANLASLTLGWIFIVLFPL